MAKPAGNACTKCPVAPGHSRRACLALPQQQQQLQRQQQQRRIMLQQRWLRCRQATLPDMSLHRCQQAPAAKRAHSSLSRAMAECSGTYACQGVTWVLIMLQGRQARRGRALPPDLRQANPALEDVMQQLRALQQALDAQMPPPGMHAAAGAAGQVPQLQAVQAHRRRHP